MATVEEIRCDFCSAVLVGIKGRVKISHGYLEIAGFVRNWDADPQTGWRSPTFISAPDKRPMMFCTENNATCFADYIDMKVASWRVRVEQKKRDGATGEQELRERRGMFDRDY